MSLSSDLNKLRKKRLEEEAKMTPEERAKALGPALTGFSTGENPVAVGSDEYRAIQKHMVGYDSAMSQYNLSKAREEAEKGKDDSWVKAGAFDDGYQFGDISKTLLSTGGDIITDVAQGFLGVFEGSADFLLNRGADLSDAFGWKEGANFMRDAAEFGVVSTSFDPLDDLVDENSLLGDKAEVLGYAVGSVGAELMNASAGLAGIIGVTSAWGSGETQARLEGATKEEAQMFGLLEGIKAGIVRKLAGGLGKGVNQTGVSKGIGGLDDAIATKMTSKISNTFVKNLAQAGIKATGEGFEEAIEGFGTAVNKKLTYMTDEDFGKLVEDEQLLEQFAMGAFGSAFAQSGLMPGTYNGNNGNVWEATRNGVDYTSGRTKNEQAVIDREFEKRVAAAEESGKKLSKSEKNKLYDQVIEDMANGGISIDTIEEVLGGDSYKAYQDYLDNEKSILAEYEELGKKQGATLEEQERFRELYGQVKDIKASRDTEGSEYNVLRDKLSQSTVDFLKAERKGKGSGLISSYVEEANSKVAFQADVNSYEEKHRATIQRAIDSNVINNTRAAHTFVEFCARLEAETGVIYDFTNNKKLKETRFWRGDGTKVNAYYDRKSNTIGINVDSPKAWQSSVGHEITHTLEGTELYAEMQKALFDYAEAKGELKSRREALAKLYKAEDVDSELAADLVGDYLFTDKDFIVNLSKNRNLFQKIYDEIKYLYKIATAGSKEKRQLEEIKYKFEQAYKGDVKKADAKTEGKVQHSLTMVDAVKPTSDKWAQGATTDEVRAAHPTLYAVDEDATTERNPTQVKGTIGSYRKIYDVLQSEGFNGTILDASSGLGYGTKAGIEEYGFDVEDIEPYPDSDYKPKHTDYSALDKTYDVVISNAVLNVLPQDQRDALVVKMGELLNPGGRMFVNVRGKDVLNASGKIAINEANMEYFIPRTAKTGSYQKGFTKAELVAYLQDALGEGYSVQPTNMFGAVSAIVTKDSDVKYSLSADTDSEGRGLSVEQNEFFKDSKMRDENGSLKVMYHGSQSAGFHIFDPAMSDDEISLFFVDSNDVAASYSGTSETYEAQTIRTAEDMNKFFSKVGKADVIEKADSLKKELDSQHRALLNDLSAHYASNHYDTPEAAAEADLSGKEFAEIAIKAGLLPSDLASRLNAYHKLKTEANKARIEAQKVNNDIRYYKVVEEGGKFTLLYKGDRVAESDTAQGIYDEFCWYEGVGEGDANYKVYLNLKNPYIVDGEGNAWNDLYDSKVSEYLDFVEDWPLKTRDFAQYAKENGYDGVIFNNIVDVGGYGNGSEGASTVAIAFSSEQVKSVANEKPTGDPDIRYSLSSMANTFFGDENMSPLAFKEADYTQTQGYKDYVIQCVNNLKQTRADFDEVSARREVKTSIDGIVRVALAAKQAGYDIHDDASKRDAKDSKDRLLFSSLEPNSDYFTSNDISTECDKRKNFADIYDAIVKKEEALGVPQGKRFFDNVDNYFYLHKVLADKGLTQPCRECYVESMRKNLAPMANAFLRLVGETNPNNKANDQLYQQKGKNKGVLKSNNAATREWVLEKLSEYGMTAADLSVEMLTTEDGLAQLKIQAPMIYEAFNSFYGQSKPKMPRKATPFRFGELTALLTDHNGKIKPGLVDKINSTGGFRLQSYSDFQVENYTDVLQVIFEAGTLGLNGHAYTKVPSFLEATDGTNLKRNISIFMYKDGGEWKLDRNDSFPYTLEEIYDIVKADKSGNTSIIAVSQNAEMSAWIMANDLVGYGIPFHKSGLKMNTVRDTDIKTEDGRIIKGYSGTIDHTKQQTEVWKTTTADHKALTKVKKGINIYGEEVGWDFDNKDNLSKNELIEKNVKAYIDACENAGYIPKFRDYVMNNGKVLNDVLKYAKELGFASPDATIEDISFEYKGYTIPYGYYKFLGDFGMFTPDGKASPQKPLSLENYDFDKAVNFFSDSEALHRNEILQQFANGAEREYYRNSDLTAGELKDIIRQKRGEVVDSVVAGQASLSDVNETPKRYGDFYTPASDLRFNAPMSEDIAPVANVQETAKDAGYDGFAPITEDEANAMRSEGFASLTDADAPPEAEAPYYGESADAMPSDPFEDRDIKAVGNRKVKAYMYENPEVKPFFQAEANVMLGELERSTKGERLYTPTPDGHYDKDGSLTYGAESYGVFTGIKRQTSDDIAYLLDECGYSYAEIEKGLKAIIEDDGKENNACSKRIEFLLNDRLLHGYRDFDGYGIPENQDYINLLNEKQITEYNDEARKSFFDVADEYAPPADFAPLAEESAVTEEAKEAASFYDTANKGEVKGQQTIFKEPEVRSEQPIKTIKDRLQHKLNNAYGELSHNKRLRREAIEDYNAKIAELELRYDSKKNKTTKVANNILRSIERYKRLRDDVDASYTKRINDLRDRVEKAKAELEEGYSDEEGRTMRSELHAQKIDEFKNAFAENGLDFDETLKNGKNLSTWSTVDNTPQRVNEKAFGYKAGQIISDLTVNKVAQNETEGIRWLNTITSRRGEGGLLKQLSKEYHIYPGSKKSAAAQMYAEGFYVNDNNEIIKYGDAELAKDFPDKETQENIKGLAGDPRIRQFYDETLAKINESRTRNAYPEIKPLDNYFLHFRAMDDTFSRMGIPFNPNDIKAKDLPTDLNGVTADLKPGQPYFASAMHRRGNKTTYDLLGGMERYASGAKNQIYHIDDIQTLRAFRNYIADTYGQGKGLENLDSLSEEEVQDRIKQVFGSHLSTYAKFLNEEANVIAGKTALIDRGLEGIIGRRGIQFLNTVNQQVGSNMVGLNLSSSLTNLLSVTQAFAKTNKTAFVKGFAQTVANKVGRVFRKADSFADNPTAIRRKGADRFYRTPWQKTSDVGYALMSAVDNVATEIIVRSKYNEYIQKGMSEQQAITEADKWASRLMGDRSLGQMPQLYNSKMLGLITKFQLEVRNQLDSQFYDTIQEAKASNEDIENGLAKNAKTAAKVAATFAELAVAQHIFGQVFKAIAGYNPAFDIIEVISQAFGWDDEEDSEDTALDNVEQAFLGLLEDLPYTSTFTGGRIPISSALPIEELVTGKDEYGNEKPRLDTLKEIAPYYLLPTGYGQIKKTAQGLSMFSDEHPVAGSYTDSGNLRFPVDDTIGNRIQAGLFGQYASENARYYFDNDIAPLKEKQIEEYADVGMPIKDYWKYRENLSKYNTLAEKADYINSLDLTTEQKNILINNIADREEDIDMSDYDDYGSFNEFDFAVKNPEKYEFLKDNGVSYDEYNASEESREMYNWAYRNPERITVAKAVGGLESYMRYSDELYDIKADKDKYGKSISGSRKEKVIDYINNLDADYGTKIILFKSEYNADDTYNYDIIEYLNSRNDISYKDMETILKELGFNVDSNGNITWD